MKTLVDAFTLLTIIPVPSGKNDDPGAGPSKFAPLFFPLVGGLIGLLMAAAVVSALDGVRQMDNRMQVFPGDDN